MQGRAFKNHFFLQSLNAEQMHVPVINSKCLAVSYVDFLKADVKKPLK